MPPQLATSPAVYASPLASEGIPHGIPSFCATRHTICTAPARATPRVDAPAPPCYTGDQAAALAARGGPSHMDEQNTLEERTTIVGRPTYMVTFAGAQDAQAILH